MCDSTTTNILIVDDELQIAGLIAEILQGEGYQTRLCYDGASALKSIHIEKPTLMLLDINMPILTGDELLQHLGPAEQRGFPVIVMTAGLMPHQYLNMGANAVLRKPFDIEHLISSVQNLAQPCI